MRKNKKLGKTFLKRISVRYSAGAYSFHCALQLLIWGEILAVGWVGECCSEPSVWVGIP